MSSKKTRFSRRGFLGGIGIGAAGTGLLEREAEASPAPAAVSGPGAVPITLNINGKPVNLKVEPRVTLLDAMRNYMEPPLTPFPSVKSTGAAGAEAETVGPALGETDAFVVGEGWTETAAVGAVALSLWLPFSQPPS